MAAKKAKATKKAKPATKKASQETVKVAHDSVQAYETALKVVTMFEEEHPKIFATYKALLEELEVARQAADLAVRSADISIGPWVRLSESTRYKAEELFNQVGAERFAELGGTRVKEWTYKVDRPTLDVAIAAKKLPEDVVEKIRTITPSFSVPSARS